MHFSSSLNRIHWITCFGESVWSFYKKLVVGFFMATGWIKKQKKPKCCIRSWQYGAEIESWYIVFLVKSSLFGLLAVNSMFFVKTSVYINLGIWSVWYYYRGSLLACFKGLQMKHNMNAKHSQQQVLIV